jgi:alkanesulfonate monooxygenase SsuD/methylene tetrahydromethanopterin reductase-like flavin-dependent oxidoreductase (luciferase family)
MVETASLRRVEKRLDPATRIAAPLARRASALVLPFDDRKKSRMRATLATGEDVAVFLPRGTVLRHGDLLVASDGAMIRVEAAPETVLLGGSPDGAALAARLGWRFCYAGHFNGDDVSVERSLDAYRDAGGVDPLVALYAVAAPTRDEAEQLIGALRIFKLRLASGQSFNLGSAQAAAEFARQSGATDYRIDELRPTVLADTPERVHRALDALSRRLGVDEFVIDSPVTDYAARLASVEWLGGAAASACVHATADADSFPPSP